MVNVNPLNAVGASYNAVKIRINEPKTTIPEGFKAPENDHNRYNAIDIAVNRPAVEVVKDKTYDYPQATSPVSSDYAGFTPVDIPQLPPPPLAYNLINNRTFVNAKFDLDSKIKDEANKETKDVAVVPEPNITTTEAEKDLTFHGLNTITEPETEESPAKDLKEDSPEGKELSFKAEPETEETAKGLKEDSPEGKELSFKAEPETEETAKGLKEDSPEGKELSFKAEPETEETAKGLKEDSPEGKELSFKAEPETEETAKGLKEDSPEGNKVSFKAEKKTPEIVEGEDITPEVDINQVVANLSDKDLDVQAKQIADIVSNSKGQAETTEPYVQTDVFNSLIDIINKDTSSLSQPTERQLDTRKKIIVNELYTAQSKAEGVKEEEMQAPYTISEEELADAISLSELEQAERNKIYALEATALLAKTYADETEKRTGNIVPLTDLPGVSTMVDAIRYNQNPDIKLAAIASVAYIAKPEYKDELVSVMSLAMQDESPIVAKGAAVVLNKLES
jgi:hypothetical protein